MLDFKKRKQLAHQFTGKDESIAVSKEVFEEISVRLHPSRIITDPDTGAQMLMPPAIFKTDLDR